MAAGVCASTAGAIVSHPLDTLKVRIQLNHGQDFRIMQVIREMNAKEGVRGYFRGMMSTIVGRVPVSSVMYTA